jgi:hypothetical protein
MDSAQRDQDLDQQPASHPRRPLRRVQANHVQLPFFCRVCRRCACAAAATADRLHTVTFRSPQPARRGYARWLQSAAQSVWCTTWRCALGIPSQVLRCLSAQCSDHCGASDGCRSDFRPAGKDLLYASSTVSSDVGLFIQRSALRGPRPGCRRGRSALSAWSPSQGQNRSQNHRQRSICAARAT